MYKRQGQNADNPGTFSAIGASSFGISSRSYLSGPGQTVTWSDIPNWNGSGEAMAAQRTPDLQTIVQALVNRVGWNSGNAMVFKFQNTGAMGTNAARDARSFDAGAESGPLLEVNYTEPCSYEVEPNTKYEVRIPSSNFNSGNALESLSPTSSNSDSSANGDLRDSDGTVSSGMDVFAPVMTGENGKNDHTYDFGFNSSTTYSVGNRLWFDTNDNGIIDGSEIGIAGGSVSIFLDGNSDGSPDMPGSPIDTVTTDSDGYYRFDGLAAGNYVIRIDPSNFTSGGMLAAYANTTGDNSNDDESSGASSNAENGINPVNAADVITDGILSDTILLGPGEPSSEADVPSSGGFAGQGAFDTQANMTVDYGFYKLTLSGTVWVDTGQGADTNDGELDSGESRLAGYRVRLFDSSGNEIPVGLDGILGTADDALSGVITDGSGNYSFMGMPAGDYRVVVDASGGVSSTPTEADPNSNGDNNDNGFPDNTGNFPGLVISGIVTLTPGSAGAAGNNAVTNADAQTADPTVDFGFVLAPTAVKMDKVGAYFDGSNVVVEWSTGDEVGNLGFNVYREVGGQKELITSAPIAGSALKSAVDLRVKGNSYRWVDKGTKYGGVYYVEDLDIDGNKTLHGPIQPQLSFKFESYNETSSKLLSELAVTEGRSTQKEYVGDIPKADTGSDNNFASGTSLEVNKQREIAAMNGVKLYVNESGWYRVEATQLGQAGFDVSSNRDLWQLFSNGREMPMRVNNDSIEFYGRGVDTKLTDERAYYLVVGKQTGRRIGEAKSGEADGKTTVFNYDVTVQKNDRSIYVGALLNGEKSNWFGSPIFSSGETIQTIEVSDPYDNGTNQATLKVKLQGFNDVNHLVQIKFNELDLGVVEFFGKENREFEFNVPMSELYSDVNVVKLQSIGASNDISLIDEIRLRYTRGYKADNGQIRFSVPANQVVEVEGFEDSAIDLYEIGVNGELIGQAKINPEEVEGSYKFSLKAAGYDQEFIAIERSNYERGVARIERNNPSSLNSVENEADFIIITHQSLRKQADVLAERRNSQGLRTVVVNVEDVYDEYSFGMRSVEAIKEFLNEAKSVWKVQPNYVLIFGDSSADHRNYLNQENRDLVPTKLLDTEFSETSSDGWFADFDEDGIEEMSIGRLPVGDVTEAKAMIAKLIRYDNQKGRIKETNLLVADNFFEAYNDSLESRLPRETGAVRINRSEMSDGQMRSRILSDMEQNPMVVTYTGHGSTGIWASANVLRDTDVASFNNDKLAFFMLMTCLNGYSHSPYSDSLSEVFMKAENAAIATWASSGETYASQQILMSRSATSNLFTNGSQRRIGDLTRAAKQTTTDIDARRTWQLLGDPTIVIK